MLRILDITAPDINNGNGIRITLWVAGCSHKCKGCHNAWTWDYNQGIKFIENQDEILNILSNRSISLLSGLGILSDIYKIIDINILELL